jgi:GTP-binding protein HflX
LLHVVDSASPNRERQIAAVDKVLEELGAEHNRIFRVYNKIDLIEIVPAAGRNEYGKLQAVHVSARTGAGLDLLRAALAEILSGLRFPIEPTLLDAIPSQTFVSAS